MADDLSPYELERAALIQRNRARLEALGIPLAAATLAPPLPTRPPAPARAPRAPRAAAQPARSSRRLRGGPATRSAGPAASPRRSPLSSPLPPPPPKKWDPAELAEIEAQRAAVLADRLTELDLAGLIDCTRPAGDPSDRTAEARFAVVGAPHKGRARKHYLIVLASDATGRSVTHTCQCMDFKMRRARTGQACKHITLVLTQLGCVDKPVAWPECMRARVLGGTGGCDVVGGGGRAGPARVKREVAGGGGGAPFKLKAEPDAAPARPPRTAKVKAEPD